MAIEVIIRPDLSDRQPPDRPAGLLIALLIAMTLDREGVLINCPSCQTRNRLRYAGLGRATKCGKCQMALPFPSEPIDVSSAEVFDAATAAAGVP
ncbi:MAG TPA: hypothetical protein VEC39_00005, partial [Vicinamibacterales bacterium]|nr:hypothetical protein [Vicinamibacterales bacterium]